MPLDGEKLDELLSGFIDDRLSPSELMQIEEALSSDARARERLSQFRSQKSDLFELGQRMVAGSRLQPDFAGRVVQLVQHRAELNGNATLRVAASTTRLRRILATGVLAAAAAVLLLVALPSWMQPTPSESLPPLVQNSAPPDSAVDAAAVPAVEVVPAVEYVGEMKQDERFAFALIVDVQIQAEAMKFGVLANVLNQAGIIQAEPIQANAAVLKTLDETRMIVQPSESGAEDTIVFVIRANNDDLDQALRTIFADAGNFPNVSLNVAMDARASLIREILHSLGRRFTVDDSFAVALDVHAQAGPPAGIPNPFPGSTKGVQYISSVKRSSGWETSLPQTPAGSMSTILLVVRVVD